MSNFKADKIQVGSIQDAIGENIDGELIFKDGSVPQGISLKNLVSDVSFAQQIQDNTDQYLEVAVENAISNIQAGSDAINQDTLNKVNAISGDLYDDTYVNYLISSTEIGNNVTKNVDNRFNGSIGINEDPIEAQLHVKNKKDDFNTVIRIDNNFASGTGENATFTLYKSEIRQLADNLTISTLGEGTITLKNANGNDVSPELSVSTFNNISKSSLKLETIEATGTEVTTATGGGAVATGNFNGVLLGAKLDFNGEHRYIEEKTSDEEVILDKAVESGSFTYENPLLFSETMLINADGNIGLNTFAPSTKLHIKDRDAILVEDTEAHVYLGQKEDTYGDIYYEHTTDVEEVSGFALVMSSKRLEAGASIRVNAVSNNAKDNTTASGEIEFLTSKYEYNTTNEDVVRAKITNTGNMGVNVDKPLSKLHVNSESLLTLTGTVSISAGSSLVKGSMINDQDEHQTLFTQQVSVGDAIIVNGEERLITEINDDFSLLTNVPFTSGAEIETAYVRPSAFRVDIDNTNVLKIDNYGDTTLQNVNTMEINAMGDISTQGDISIHGTNDVTFTSVVSTSGTKNSTNEFIQVVVNGDTRYIQLYS